MAQPYAAQAKKWLEKRDWLVGKVDGLKPMFSSEPPYADWGRWAVTNAKAVRNHARMMSGPDGELSEAFCCAATRRSLNNLAGHLEQLAGDLSKPPGYTPAMSVDLWGFGDFIAIPSSGPDSWHPLHEVHRTPPVVVIVQATSKQLIARHLHDYRKKPDVVEKMLWWLEDRRRKIWMMGGWRETVDTQPGAKSPTKQVWRMDVRQLEASDLQQEVTR